MEQIDYSQIPRGAEVLMLQVEHTTKKATGDKKTRVVVNGAQEAYKDDEDNYAPTALAKGGQLLFALAVQEGRKKMGIDITCAFASESLTPEDGDIYVKFPDILVQHFSGLLDQQREEQKEVLAAEACTKLKKAEETVTFGSLAEALYEKSDEEEENASKGSRSKRRRQAREATFDEEPTQAEEWKKGGRSMKWYERRKQEETTSKKRVA
jgi:hypothetical protein